MNPFDAVVIAVTLIAILLGFNSGLLRSLATILGYLVAAPVAVALTPRVMPLIVSPSALTPDKTSIMLAVILVAVGIIVGALFRLVVNEFTGEDINLFDRLAGALLGAVRIGLVAVLIVIIFDKIIPANRQPPFLVDSKLRPYLSFAGQTGLKSLPPEVEDYIDRLKRERGL